ncbi:ABC-type multidrug transport system permease subunit [Chryseobacterium ginsenosidimutans]|nr:ABC-type multidrug transport system permease subunit [Chryseobacterium ginsenosidimutans]
MKRLNVPILFLLSLIIQIIFSYLFIGNNPKISFFIIAAISNITSTFLSYSMLYYISKSKDEHSNESEIKIGLTTFYFVITNVFMVFLFFLIDQSFNFLYLIVINSIILTVYGRQIINKEIKQLIP